jgi:hypothetical protein
VSRLRPTAPAIPPACDRQRATGKDTAPDFRERVADALASYADELPRDADAGALYDEWVALSLALGRGVLASAGRRLLDPVAEHLEAGESAGPQAWVALLRLGRELHLDGPDVAGFPSLARHPGSAEVTRRMLGWVSELVERAGGADDGVVRELGGLHELFLGLALERLSHRARRLRRSRAWLNPAEVLGWPSSVRSKRLQRELGLSKHVVHALGAALAAARTSDEVEQSVKDLLDPREPPRPAGRSVVRTSGGRRSSGAHYTPWPLCVELVERVLGPVVEALPEPRSRSLLALRVCDPAMGAGAFLIAVTHYLSGALVRAWRREGAAPHGSIEEESLAARRLIATHVLRGVDENPTAVRLARWSLGLWLAESAPPAELGHHLLPGDALIGGVSAAPSAATTWARSQPRAFDWREAFPDVFSRDRPGFDAIVGNPPWVAYVGRAAQPLEPARAAYYAATNPAFKRYRTLHGLFVYRSATLLRPGGRLGLVLPTSVADLPGYAATRAAHDALCHVDAELPDWGDGAFDGVFQPCMALLSTRREPSAPRSTSDLWPLRNDVLGAAGRRLLERLARLPRLPRELFGERGFQTTEDDQAHLRRAPNMLPPCTVALREGADIGEFRALPPQLFGDPVRLGTRLRPPAAFREVKLLIRQTARFPMAALSDGAAFRNSILAGFETPEFPATLLLGLLNSSLIRWVHFVGQRDARQGMPQLKVGHLRALPGLPADAGARGALDALARELAATNAGIDRAQRQALDALVSEAFELTDAERQLVADWASLNPPPTSRRRPPNERAPRPADDLGARGL